MFGCVVAGRALQADIRQIDETHAMFELPQAEQINHVCVFLVGTVPFPDGFGASVHFFWPGKGFQLLGMLSNDKPSAIFRLRGAYTAQSTTAHAVFSGASTPIAETGPATTNVTAILGIAIEPIPRILEQVSTLPASSLATRATSPLADVTVLAERVVKHLFNYLTSFVSGGIITPETLIPMAAIARWYETFVNKVKAGGTGFLENLE